MRKEKYFTSSNIDEVSNEILSQVQTFSKRKKTKITLEKSALLILDMQHFFLEKESHAFIPSASAIIPRIADLKEHFLNNKRPVISTKHINTEENAALMNKWWRDIITEENPLSEIINEFQTNGIEIISKTQYDAFYKTDLLNRLKTLDVSQVVITGVMTHVCCETTARSAFVRGIEPFFPIDCTAAYNKRFHESSFYNLSYGAVIPCLSKELFE